MDDAKAIAEYRRGASVMRTMSVEKRLFAGKRALSDEKVCFLIESAFFALSNTGLIKTACLFQNFRKDSIAK